MRTLANQQERVDALFQSSSAFWADIYEERGLEGTIYQERRAAILGWIDELGLPPAAQILEVGCGAGAITVALAERGYPVSAIDSTEAMVELTRRHAAERGLEGTVAVGSGDVHSLHFERESFALVVAVGVIPWLHSPEQAVQEMARVVASGGYVIVTADNRARLNRMLDPRLSPVLAPLRIVAKKCLELLGLRKPRPSGLLNLHSTRYVDRLMSDCGLTKQNGMTLGFGPLSFFERKILPDFIGIRLHRALQKLADWNVPGFRSAGAHYIVLARKT